MALPVSVELIQQHINALSYKAIEPIFVFDELSSTNDWLLDYMVKNPGADALCVADKQTKGRGRAGRAWISPANSNIYMSLSCHLDLELRDIASLSLVVGLAVIRVLKVLGLEAKIKWPNDVLVKGQKVAGVLIETRKIEKKIGVVIGLGVNVDMRDEIISESGLRSTDLRRNGVNIMVHDRNQLVVEFLREIQDCIDLFVKRGFSAFRHEWVEQDAYFGKQVEIKDAEKVIVSGIESGVNDQGMLLVDVAGEIKQVHGGDLSLRIKR